MKCAHSIRLVLTLAIAATAVGWLPEQKGKRKLRMADAAATASAVAQRLG